MNIWQLMNMAADEHAYGYAPAQDSSSPCEEELQQ